MGMLKEVLIDAVRDGIPFIVGLIALLFFFQIAYSTLNPPPKPKYWTIKYADGVYTTDTISYTPVGCVTIPRYVLCGDMIVTEKEGKLPNERFD